MPDPKSTIAPEVDALFYFVFWTSLVIVLFSLIVISAQILDRQGFASGDLRRDAGAVGAAPTSPPESEAVTVNVIRRPSIFSRCGLRRAACSNRFMAASKKAVRSIFRRWTASFA